MINIVIYRNVLASNGLMSCQDSYNDHISFPGDGYARIGQYILLVLFTDMSLFSVDVYNPRIKYGFYLEFRTLQSSGLLLYSASLFHEDHTALEISNGTVSYNHYFLYDYQNTCIGSIYF